MHELGGCEAKWNEPGAKTKATWAHLYAEIFKAEFTETESRKPVEARPKVAREWVETEQNKVSIKQDEWILKITAQYGTIVIIMVHLKII